MRLQTLTFTLLTTLPCCLSMHVARSDGQNGRGITLTPRSGTYSNVLLWFHGLGDTADGWADMMPSLSLEDTKFILPTAFSIPISINGGMEMNGWSDINGLDMESLEDREGFNKSTTRMNKIIQAEVDKGIPSKNIAVGGFSQGGALALHLSLRSPQSFAGCVALSTWLPLRDDYPGALSPFARSMPIFQAHGSADQVVNHGWGRSSHLLLKTMIPAPEPAFMTIKGMGHSSHPEEINALKTFLKSILR